jgi:hypothetical protein
MQSYRKVRCNTILNSRFIQAIRIRYLKLYRPGHVTHNIFIHKELRKRDISHYCPLRGMGEKPSPSGEDLSMPRWGEKAEYLSFVILYE